MSRFRILSISVASSAVALALAAFGNPSSTAAAIAAVVRAGDERNGTSLQYGESAKVGDGRARAYVVTDQKTGAPLEVGVALDERAMDGLPAPNRHAGHQATGSHEHLDNHVYLLSLPGRGAAPFQFVELDWNPGGHEPPGVYDTPHFDFHFWMASQEERAAIVPSDPRYQQLADALPPEGQRPQHFVVAAPPGAPAPGVPLMGVHWTDVRSPELQQIFGKPEGYRPFTTTFLYGSWNGRFTFLEPMITRAYILSKKAATDPAARDEVIAISAPERVGTSGYYPGAYRITWDAQSNEYRIALTKLSWRE